MARMFWVTCPQCDERFHAHYDEFRHSGAELLCPMCGHRFEDAEAASVQE